jgi:periplasmic protein CpxP/Spy
LTAAFIKCLAGKAGIEKSSNNLFNIYHLTIIPIMKKQIFLLLAVMFISFTAVKAQGGMQRQTPEERTKAAIEKLAPLLLSGEQTAKTTTVFTDHYTNQQKAMEEMRAAGSMDREAMQAKRKEMNDARDVKLKEIFTADQFKKWKEEIEPAMMPTRKPNQ